MQHNLQEATEIFEISDTAGRTSSR
jgi:hypothetical protein